MRIRLFLSCILLSFILTIQGFASGSSNYVYEYADEQITVVFAENSVFSSDEQQYIADKLVLGDSAEASGVQPRSWCWLTGHELVTECVHVITHKVYASAPRCVKETYLVETCSNCDQEMTLISEENIYCCDEE